MFFQLKAVWVPLNTQHVVNLLIRSWRLNIIFTLWVLREGTDVSLFLTSCCFQGSSSPSSSQEPDPEPGPEPGPESSPESGPESGPEAYQPNQSWTCRYSWSLRSKTDQLSVWFFCCSQFVVCCLVCVSDVFCWTGRCYHFKNKPVCWCDNARV